MQASTLRQMVALARSREDHAAAELRAAQARLQRSLEMHEQLDSFGTEYRLAALDPQRSASRVGYTVDALAFGQRLHATAAQQKAGITHQEVLCEASQRALVQVRHRAQILQKMLDKELRKQRLAVERREEREVEEVINTRWHQRTGTEPASEFCVK